MTTGITISDVRFTAAPITEQSRGLLGWLRVTVNGLIRLDGITLRRTALGRLTLSYPERRDRIGLVHPYIRPTDDSARHEIETQVFALIHLDPEATP